MTSIEKVSIALSREMLAVVRKAVAGGDYSSTSEVVREALREWKQRRSVVANPPALNTSGARLLPLSTAKAIEVQRLCREFGVRRLAVFGSALEADFSSTNDLDLAVEFGKAAQHSLVDQYLGFKAGMERLFSRRVDLVELAAMPESRLKRHIQNTACNLHVEPEAA